MRNSTAKRETLPLCGRARESWRSVVPRTYMADALRQVMVGATPQFSLGIDVTAMVAFLAILSVAAVRLFQWE